MARAYFGTRISENIVRTPEGFLVARNVPIGRTGWQEYRGSELGLDSDDLVQVYRSPEEVFHPAAVASFEGKTVTNDHPPEWIQPANEGSYHRGHLQNVRPGEGAEKELLIGDLFVKDAGLIHEIEHGKREVSCGYDCVYEPLESGGYAQKQIRGNHVAVVSKGRAGDGVAIRDSAPSPEENPADTKPSKEKGKTIMNLRKHLIGLGLKAFAQDAEPEKIAEAMEAAKETESQAEKRNEDCNAGKSKDALPVEGGGGECGSDPIREMLGKILLVLEQLVVSNKDVHEALLKPPEPEDALDKLVSEIENPEEQAGEQISGIEDAGVVEPDPVLPPGDRTENPIPNADSKAVVDMIRTMKPIIAAITDKAARQKATDVLVAAVKGPGSRGAGKAPARKDGGAGYAALLGGKPPGTQDSKKPEDPAALGEEIRLKYHKKIISKA